MVICESSEAFCDAFASAHNEIKRAGAIGALKEYLNT